MRNRNLLQCSSDLVEHDPMGLEHSVLCERPEEVLKSRRDVQVLSLRQSHLFPDVTERLVHGGHQELVRSRAVELGVGLRDERKSLSDADGTIALNRERVAENLGRMEDGIALVRRQRQLALLKRSREHTEARQAIIQDSFDERLRLVEKINDRNFLGRAATRSHVD